MVDTRFRSGGRGIRPPGPVTGNRRDERIRTTDRRNRNEPARVNQIIPAIRNNPAIIANILERIIIIVFVLYLITQEMFLD